MPAHNHLAPPANPLTGTLAVDFSRKPSQVNSPLKVGNLVQTFEKLVYILTSILLLIIYWLWKNLLVW
jgi:hypothetical protein